MNIEKFIDAIINGPARYTQEHYFSPGWSLTIVIWALLMEIGMLYFLILLLAKSVQSAKALFSFALRHMGVGKVNAGRTFLQITFPDRTIKTSHATKQLHVLIYGLVRYKNTSERIAAHKKPYSLELVATYNGGIRYILCVSDRESKAIKRNIMSFIPGIKIEEVDDYIKNIENIPAHVIELKLANDFVLPLASQQLIEKYDTVAYLTGQMRNLLPDETIAIQFVTAPVLANTHSSELRHMHTKTHHIT